MSAPLRLVGPDFESPAPRTRRRGPKCCPLCLGPVYSQRPDNLLHQLDAALTDPTTGAHAKTWAAEYYAKQLIEHRAGLCDSGTCARRAVTVFATLLLGLRVAGVAP
jgi:hypothetical protein